MFGHFDLHYIYIFRIYTYISIRYRYISISILCVFNHKHKQDDVCDTFSIFLRISDSAIKDQIFSKKECKQKLYPIGEAIRRPLKDGVYFPTKWMFPKIVGFPPKSSIKK